MSEQQLQNLIRMVNQISANNTHHSSDELAVDVIAGHLKKFWARSMKQQIIAYSDAQGAELSPISKRAIERLKVLSGEAVRPRSDSPPQSSAS